MAGVLSLDRPQQGRVEPIDQILVLDRPEVVDLIKTMFLVVVPLVKVEQVLA